MIKNKCAIFLMTLMVSSQSIAIGPHVRELLSLKGSAQLLQKAGGIEKLEANNKEAIEAFVLRMRTPVFLRKILGSVWRIV